MTNEIDIENGVVATVRLLMDLAEHRRVHYTSSSLICRLIEAEATFKLEDQAYILESLVGTQFKESDQDWRLTTGLNDLVSLVADIIEKHGNQTNISDLRHRLDIVASLWESRDAVQHIQSKPKEEQQVLSNWDTTNKLEANSSNCNDLSESEDDDDWIIVETETAHPA